MKFVNHFNKDIALKELYERYNLDFIKYFLDNNARVYLFGGAPRDMVMGRKWKDADFCICIPLENDKRDFEADRIFKLAGIEIKSKTVLNPDITIYRFFPDGSSSDVGIDVRVVSDIWKGGTDFTINYLRFDIVKGELVDGFNSIGDIESKILKTATKAEEAFKDNPTMFFRATKAACQFGFDIDEDVLAEMKKSSSDIDVCVDIISKNQSGFAEWVLSNMLAGLKYNPFLFQKLLNENNGTSSLVQSISNRLHIGTEYVVSKDTIFDSKKVYTYEEAISIFFSNIARMIDPKNPENTFSLVVDLLKIKAPKIHEDVLVDSLKIAYTSYCHA